MYKMVIIDLDGTLLNDQKEISNEDAYIINRSYREKGTICVIATGRSYICAKYLADIVGEGLSQYIIASTGSEIRDIKNNLYLNKQCISNENTVKILECVQKYNFRCNVDISSKVISNSRLVNQEILDKIGQKYEIKENLLEYFTTNNIDSISFTIIEICIPAGVDPLEITRATVSAYFSGLCSLYFSSNFFGYLPE